MKHHPIHILQVSKDVQLLNDKRNNEPYQRQLEYLRAIREMRGEDCEMTILVLSRKSKLSSFQDNGLNIVSVSASFWYRFIGIFLTVYRINRKLPIRVLTTQAPIDEGWLVLLFGKMFNIPVIAQIHFDIFDDNAIIQILGEGIRGRVRFAIFKRTIKYHKKIRVVGRSIAKNLSVQCCCTEEQISLIPVMVPLLNGDSGISRNKLVNEPFRILFVGRLVPQKNLFFLLEIAYMAISKDQSILFDIVGSGPLRQELEERSIVLGIEEYVFFHGEISYFDLPKFYSGADVFILTSYYEGFGRVLVEAGAFELPILSTKITGPEDIIDNGFNGYLLDLQDLNGFVDKILYLKKNEEQRLLMGKNNFNLVHQRYDQRTLQNEWIDLLLSK